MYRVLLICALAFVVSAQVNASGGVQRGEEIYVRCLACHALTYDRVGPRHCGLFGRRAGSVKGFDYSLAMKQAKIIWNEKTLNAFLSKPMKMVPGTTMTYDGVPNKQERDDLIAYLKSASESTECKKVQ